MLHNFTITDNKLFIGGITAKDLIEKYGSPLYVYDAAIIRQRFLELKESISYKPTTFYYASKQNTNLEIIKLLKKAGAKIEVMSRAEIAVALKAGYMPNELIYTSSYISKEEIEDVVQKGVFMNLDSLTQIKRFGEIRPGGEISIRINQGIGAGGHAHIITGGPESKFGIDVSQIPEAKKLAEKYGLKITGIQQHIGSNVLDEAIFIKAIRKLLETAKQFDALQFIDFGGGFGIPYTPDQKPLSIQTLGETITNAVENFVKDYGRHVEIRFEPGRFYVAEAGVLLAKVTEIKQTPYRKFVGIESGMNQFIRPALYEAYHEIINATNVHGKKECVSVVGNICESADFFAKERMLPIFQESDVVAILDVGASGYSMGSFYNGRPLPTEVLVDGERTRVIRKKAEYSF